MFTNSRGWIFLSLVSLFFMILGQIILGRQGLLLGFFVATTLNFYIYFLSEKIVFKYYKAKLLQGQDSWGVLLELKKISDQFRTPPAQIFITTIDSPIIFCSHRGWGKNKILFSQALLDKLSKEEIHDLLTIHMFYLLSAGSFFVGFRSQLAEILFVIARAIDSFLSIPIILTGRPGLVIFQKILQPFMKILLRSYKKSLLKTDEQAAKMIGSNERLAKLLWKLESLFCTKPIHTPPSPNILFLVNPLTKEGLNLYFQRHYDLDLRIKNLIGHYPI